MLAQQQVIHSGVDLFNYQAQFLQHLHTSLLYVNQIGVFFVFFGTLYGTFEIYARTLHETFRVIVPRVHNLKHIRKWNILYSGGIGMLLLWTGWDPVEIITPAAIIGGVLTCGLWALGMVWVDRKFLPLAYRMPRLLLILTAISGIVLTFAGMLSFVQWLMGFFA
jgi:hypothetical protein